MFHPSPLRARTARAGREQAEHVQRRPLGVHERAFTSPRHRQSHARQRSRGRGHCARRVGTLADGGSQRGSGPAGIPCDDDETIGDQRHPVPLAFVAKRASGPGCPSRSIRAPTPDWERKGAKRWSSPFGYCWRSSRLHNEPRTVLREAFDYAYREIAAILRLEEANTRQLVTRARQHVADGRARPEFGLAT